MLYFSQIKKISLILLLLISLKGISQIQVVQYQLDNGLTVILNPDQNLNSVSGAVAVNTGSKNDPIDATGISHYLEHLLFKGTDKLGTANFEAEKVHLDSITFLYDKMAKTTSEEERKSIQSEINLQSVKAAKYAMPKEFDQHLREIGGTGINATTSQDLTIYYNDFPAHSLNKWLDLYAERFRNPIFRSFQSELEVVYEEKNRAMDNMERRLFEAYGGFFFKNHPYGEKKTLGTIEHLKNPSLSKMYAYYKKYYVANNMALILSGNFDLEEAKRLIENSFYNLAQGLIEDEKIEQPKPFSGREFHKVKLTPVTAGIMGFRTAPRFHEDYAALMICGNLLQNESQTGLIDELKKNNQLMMAFAFADFYDEAGEMTFIFIPKILRQSAKKAEKLMLEKIQKLKDGDFSDELFQLVKNEIYLSQERSLESASNRVRLLSDYFRKGKKWSYSEKFLDKINSLSKEEVVAIANKYLGEDYMVMYSKTGFGKKEKLDKPPLAAVEANQEQESEYGRYFDSLKSAEPKPKFVDFKKDLAIVDLKEGSRLYYVNNPMNSIFQLKLKYHLGTTANPNLIPLAEQLNYVKIDGEDLKKKIALNGGNYSFNATEDYFIVTLEGKEDELEENIKWISKLMKNAVLDESQLEIATNSLITDLRRESEDAFIYSKAMAHYAYYGKNSYFLKRQSEKELKALESTSTEDAFKELQKASISIHFSGKTNSNDLAKMLLKYYPIADNGVSMAPYDKPLKDTPADEIVLFNNKKLLQSHIFMTQKGHAFNPDDEAYM